MLREGLCNLRKRSQFLLQAFNCLCFWASCPSWQGIAAVWIAVRETTELSAWYSMTWNGCHFTLTCQTVWSSSHFMWTKETSFQSGQEPLIRPLKLFQAKLLLVLESETVFEQHLSNNSSFIRMFQGIINYSTQKWIVLFIVRRYSLVSFLTLALLTFSLKLTKAERPGFCTVSPSVTPIRLGSASLVYTVNISWKNHFNFAV